MNDRMIPPSFSILLEKLLKEYREKQSFLGVKVDREKEESPLPIGPAAGPHTQLAGNIVAAFGAGADYFELKTVQVLEGDELGIKKPCIYTQHEVYNTEWSTELTVAGALDEYIKAYILNYVLAIEFDLANPTVLTYIMSVGYDLKGIQTKKVDAFIDGMKDARGTMVWKNSIAYMKEHMTLFRKMTLEDLDRIPSKVSQTVTLSTMHGCDKEEIEAIATYLMKEKGINTYVKMNPTLLGQETIEESFTKMGYGDLTLNPHMFEVDLSMEEAVPMLERLKSIGNDNDITFGVKLTNTLPVKNSRIPLLDEVAYLSGPALYPLTIRVAAKLAEAFKGRLPISYSGGADATNVKDIALTGITPITVSSVLLKPGGYRHLSRMRKALKGIGSYESVAWRNLVELADQGVTDEHYQMKPTKQFERTSVYSDLCAACNNCVDTCPNRANEAMVMDGEKVVIHYEALCNACGNCSAYCIKGHDPYRDKWTLTGYSTFDEDILIQHMRTV